MIDAREHVLSMRICSGKFETAEFHHQVVYFGDDETDCPCCQLLRKIEVIKAEIRDLSRENVRLISSANEHKPAHPADRKVT